MKELQRKGSYASLRKQTSKTSQNGLCELASTAFFLRARAEIKNLFCDQRALLIFSVCSNPYGNPFL